jgi:hypothetical protein
MSQEDADLDLSRPLVSVAPKVPMAPRPTLAQRATEGAKSVGGALLVFGLLFAVLLAISFGIDGLAWLSVKALPWLLPIAWICLTVCILLLLPLAVPRRTRGHAAAGMILLSYPIGLTTWFFALLVTYSLWGGWAVLVGLVILGVGVVPIALLASLFGAEWGYLVALTLLTVATFAFRGGGVMLFESLDRPE